VENDNYMKDFRKKIERRKFLEQAINRHLLIERLEAVKTDAELKAMRDESLLIEELIQCLRNNNECNRLRLRRKLHLKKLL
jgi:hypothetical protein